MGRILTLDDLYRFYVDNNQSTTFSAKTNGSPIVVGINGSFATEEDDMPGMLKLKLKVCHTETNRNGSHISKENMEKAMPTLKYRPILAHIHELKDGTKDFYAHNMEIVENEDGDSEINYIEKQVGCFTSDLPWLEYDEEKDKTYVMAYSVIPEEYTDAADIIRRKNGTKVSCELVINELSYNAKEKYLDLTDFYFGGCTLLGCDEEGNEIGEGMLGARADIEDFCRTEPVFVYQDKMIEVLEKLNATLSNFNKESDMKGGNVEMNKFEELLDKYAKTVEDVTFDIDGLSDEELEAKFAEVFGDNDTEVIATDDDVVTTEDENSDVNADVDTIDSDSDNSDEKFVLKYELSHDDIRSALYGLLAANSEDEYYYAWIIEVYDNKFIYQDYTENKFYRQGYSKDGDVISLDENKVEVFNEWLSQEERDAINTLKDNYAALEEQYNEIKAFKDNYDAEVLKAEKDAILSREEYSVLAENEEFKALVTAAEQFTVDEIKTKAKEIFADHVISTGTFAAKQDVENKTKTIGFNFSAKPNKKKTAYGGLFDK